MNQKQPIKKLLNGYYAELNLSEDQLSRLLDMQAQAENDVIECRRRVTNKWCRRLLLSASQAACVILFVSGIWFSVFAPVTGPSLVEEIASNHLQPLQLDVGSSSIDEIASNLNHLSFSLVESSRLKSNQWTLLGGRYCTLQGQLAAQLKLLDNNSQKIVTLYQSAIKPNIDSPPEQKTVHGDTGVAVSIWWEDGVMLATAQ